MKKNYYVGIDMGTDSLGWAVTETNYRLCKAHGRDLWGVYLFDEEEGGAERRNFRAARRRTARVRQRLCLLQSLFAKEIAQKDPLFFLRLNNSSLFSEDKDGRLVTKDALFADDRFSDRQYFAAYPTIYHLRAALLQGDIRDVRLLYLGIHHILKNRGHFLFEGQTFETGNTEMIGQKFSEINAFLEEREWPTLTLKELPACLQVLRQKQSSKKDRQQALAQLLQADREKSLMAVVKAVTGGTVRVKDLFCLEQEGEMKTFCFEKPSFEEKELPELEREVGGEQCVLIQLLKAVYDWTVLCGIMGEEKTLSLAKVKTFEKHKADLKWLKAFVRTRHPEQYADVFRRREKKANYAAYIGMDRQKGFAKCSREEFYAFLKKELKIEDERVLAEMEKGDFLPKPVTDRNGVIPFQLHLSELKQILEQAEPRFPFLKEEQDGLTVSQKIISLMTFRIPYYVGPLHTASPVGAVRRPGTERVRVTPWNFKEVIDEDASEEKFIRRMTNKCTYLTGQDVLPANSLLYSEFTFLNELNNLRVNGVKEDRVRKMLYDYAKQHKKLTVKQALSLLIQRGILPADSGTEVFSGLDGDFKTALTPWYDLRFLGEKLETQREMCEKLILWITLISDKDRLEKRIRREYGKCLTEEEIKRLKGLNYTKWGRLSAAFLDGISSPGCPDEEGRPQTILQAMRTRGLNLMELLSGKYGFLEAIEAYQEQNTPGGRVTYQTVEELACPPSVKRAIWRTAELVREIVKIQGGAPKKLFLETAREVRDESRRGMRTVSRKQQLLELYRNIRGEERDWMEELASQPDEVFNRDKLVLYYRQMGRSLYSGKAISLDEVFNTNICDIDHIYPKSKIKDDSLDNRVLVFKEENAAKGDRYPLPAEIRTRMGPFWRELRQKGLISEKTLDRLIRSTPLTQDELADFINRQLVSTRQSTKETAKILKQMLPETEIVYSKAGNVNTFRDQFELIKVRELNDLHHAKDAFLNIVVGNVYNTKFNHNAAVFFREKGIESYNLDRLFDQNLPGAWQVSERDCVLRTFEKDTCRVVRMTTKGHGNLFDVNPVPAGKNDDLVPVKQKGPRSDTSRYGGYNKATIACFLLVRSRGKKGEKRLSLEGYPLWLDLQTGGTKEAKLQFCREKRGLEDPEILFDNIKINTLFCLNGSYAWLRGKSGNQILWCNANQLFLDKKNLATLKKVSNFLREKKRSRSPDLRVGEKLTGEDRTRLYDALTEKLESPHYAGLSAAGQAPLLKEKRELFLSLSAEDQCRVLFEILRLMQCNSVLSDLTLLGGAAHAGANTTNRFLKDLRVKMIFQSPTGHYRQVIDLEKLL